MSFHRTGLLRALLLAFLLFPSLLEAQGNKKDSFRFALDNPDQSRPLDSLADEAMRGLLASLEKQGGSHSRTPDWIFSVGTRALQEDGKSRILLAVTLLRVLPEEVIALGKEKEAFYLNLSPERRATLPTEGKWVREMVSEEAMRQFGKPVNSRISLTDRGSLQRELSRVAEELSSGIKRGI